MLTNEVIIAGCGGDKLIRWVLLLVGPMTQRMLSPVRRRAYIAGGIH